MNLKEKLDYEAARNAELRMLVAEFPDIEEIPTRKGVRFVSRLATPACDRTYIDYEGGCWPGDDTLLAAPYVTRRTWTIFGFPTFFAIGHKNPVGDGDIPAEGWEEYVRNRGYSETIVAQIARYFAENAPETEDVA